MEAFSRTLCEALRFAASDLLQVQPSEIRATFTRRDQFVEAKKNDACAGGAGYAVQLHQEISIQNLLQRAMEKLRCPLGCNKACSACLCDYSNQLSWDQFDRLPVLEWLSSLIAESKPDDFVRSGAVRWEHPSLSGLAERLSGSSHLHFTGISLDAFEGDDDSGMQWLLGLLNEGKFISIHLFRPMETNPGNLSSRMRKTLRHLYPYAKDDQLKIGYVEKTDGVMVSTLPRIFTAPQPGTLAWYSGHPISPLLMNILPEPIYQAKLNEESAVRISELIAETVNYPINKIQGGMPIQMWELSEGEERNFGEYFSFLDGVHIEQAVIKDPYCGAGEQQRSYLLDFLKMICNIAQTVKHVTIHCREQNFKDQRYMAPYKVQELLTSSIENALPHLKPKIHVHNFRDSRVFHDRTIDFQVIGKEGCSVTHRYDLSGGIDFLMNKKAASKIYRYQLPE